MVSLLEHENTNSLLTFCKNHMSKKNLVFGLWSKNLFWVMVQKPLDQTQTSKTNLSVKLKYCMWLDIHESNKFIQSFQVDIKAKINASIWLSQFIWVKLGTAGYVQSSYLYWICNMLRLNWVLILYIWVGIHRNGNLIQLFQGV